MGENWVSGLKYIWEDRVNLIEFNEDRIREMKDTVL